MTRVEWPDGQGCVTTSDQIVDPDHAHRDSSLEISSWPSSIDSRAEGKGAA
jgi:hypothetical protein